MLDLGTSFVASVSRDPGGLAIVDGAVRLTYRDWFKAVSAVAEVLGIAGLRPGDHLVTMLQNRWEAATLHWACQLTGVIITPVNWRMTARELDVVVEDCGARAVAFEPVSAGAVEGSAGCHAIRKLAIGMPAGAIGLNFDTILARNAPPAPPRATADSVSVMLYTPGTTSTPRGVPRRHRAERAAAIAHVAQNRYAVAERTLGVLPLYHTMGVRALLAMPLVQGTYVCVRSFDSQGALAAIERERVSCLFMVPTQYHDMLHHPDFPKRDLSSVRRLGFAGASMSPGLLQALDTAFAPEVFVNHYGSSEIYTLAVHQQAPQKPGSAGRAGLNQMLRVVKPGAASIKDVAAPGEEGEIIALAAGDEAFEGYWKRPELDAACFREGWYFTRDSGHFDEAGDLFVTGRVDDMIITGGENVFPVEIENLLLLHPAVDEVAVVGLPDTRWGRVLAAFVKRRSVVTPEALDEHCRVAGLANLKRPRRYVFVAELPRSATGKLLRRQLISGEYSPEAAPPG